MFKFTINKKHRQTNMPQISFFITGNRSTKQQTLGVALKIIFLFAVIHCSRWNFKGYLKKTQTNIWPTAQMQFDKNHATKVQNKISTRKMGICLVKINAQKLSAVRPSPMAKMKAKFFLEFAVSVRWWGCKCRDKTTKVSREGLFFGVTKKYYCWLLQQRFWETTITTNHIFLVVGRGISTKREIKSKVTRVKQCELDGPFKFIWLKTLLGSRDSQ